MQERKSDCDTCEEFWEIRNEDTPCETCLPQLLPANELPWVIYTQVCGQLIYVNTIAVDIDLKALFLVMDLYEVENKKDIYERVTSVCRHMIKLENKKTARELKGGFGGSKSRSRIR